MHTKFERLLSKSLTTLEVMTYYLVVHTGPGQGETETGLERLWKRETGQRQQDRETERHRQTNSQSDIQMGQMPFKEERKAVEALVGMPLCILVYVKQKVCRDFCWVFSVTLQL